MWFVWRGLNGFFCEDKNVDFPSRIKYIEFYARVGYIDLFARMKNKFCARMKNKNIFGLRSLCAETFSD